MANKEEKNLNNKVKFLRTFTILINLISLIFLITIVSLHDLLNTVLKILLILVAGSTSIGLFFALLLSSDKEIYYSLFFVTLSIFLSGFIIGVSIVVVGII
jgi:hypothetical protein